MAFGHQIESSLQITPVTYHLDVHVRNIKTKRDFEENVCALKSCFIILIFHY